MQLGAAQFDFVNLDMLRLKILDTQSSLTRTLFLDTQALIYTFEKKDAAWSKFVTSRIESGYRLVLSEELLYEFAKSQDLEAALALTRQVVRLKPLWIRSFADLEAEELHFFVASLSNGKVTEPLPVFVDDFRMISSMTQRHNIDPEQFVEFAFNQEVKHGLAQMADQHAFVLNTLAKAIADKKITTTIGAIASEAKIRALLSRGSNLVPPLERAELYAGVEQCLKHQKRMMLECRAYATEYHLSNYRSATPKRKARRSDSMDLMIAIAAFPYVSTFVTNDGFLHDGLGYVKRFAPYLDTELIRRPATNAA